MDKNEFGSVLLGGWVIHDHEGKPILHIKFGSHEDMIFFDVLEENEGWAALKEVMLFADAKMRSIPLVYTRELNEKVASLATSGLLLEKRPDNDDTGYFPITLKNYWDDSTVSIMVRGFKTLE